METRGYADGVTVNEYKLLDFLSVRLMQGNKQKGKNFGKPLSASSLRGCMTAITHLYHVFPLYDGIRYGCLLLQKQKDKGLNHYPSPRTPRVGKVVKIHQQNLFQTAGGHVQLRQKNELLQIYTDEQFRFIQEHLINRGREIDFRLKVDLNMGHFFCLRSQNRLLAELADLFMIPQAGEGINGAAVPMLFLLLHQGKVCPFQLISC